MVIAINVLGKPWSLVVLLYTNYIEPIKVARTTSGKLNIAQKN